MAYKVIATCPKLISGFPSDKEIMPGSVISEPAQVEFIDNMRPGLRDVIFEKIAETYVGEKFADMKHSKKKEE